MIQDTEFQFILKQLAEGELEPQAWLDWWREYGGQVKSLVKSGQWTRLKPKSFGDSPALSRAASS